jgi:hypothetical protein
VNACSGHFLRLSVFVQVSAQKRWVDFDDRIVLVVGIYSTYRTRGGGFIATFLVMTHCRLIGGYQSLGEIFSVHFLDIRKTKAVCVL